MFDYTFDAPGHPQNSYCRGDHANYARFGIPIVFFGTGVQADYHRVTDEPQYVDYVHMARNANFIKDVAMAVGNLDHRPVVDKPKPDPKGPCRQLGRSQSVPVSRAIRSSPRWARPTR